MTEIKLEDTVPLMLSGNFKDRGIAEFLQIKIRVGQNREFIRKWKAGELTFTPCNTLAQSEMQLKAMELYQYTLQDRLKSVLGIKSDEVFNQYIERKLSKESKC